MKTLLNTNANGWGLYHGTAWRSENCIIIAKNVNKFRSVAKHRYRPIGIFNHFTVIISIMNNVWANFVI
jgi:hypothetical protein